jgi:hypothetical protein
MPADKFPISLQPELTAEIELRNAGENRSGTISKMLSRYLYVLAVARRRLREQFSEGEISLILDALNGTGFFDEHALIFIDAEISDAISLNHLDQKWKVDGPALVRKLAALSYTDKLTLVDAAERWWNRVGKGEQNLAPMEALR